jgi:hypothetical protein
MAIPTTREEFKWYCLRTLGAPVIEINVDDDQIEDRIDEVLDYWQLYHYDGIEQLYVAQAISASSMFLTTNNAQSFNLNDTITGLTSGAQCTVTSETVRTSNGNLLLVKNFSNASGAAKEDVYYSNQTFDPAKPGVTYGSTMAPFGGFLPGETVTNAIPAPGGLTPAHPVTATLNATTPVSYGQYDNRYITLPDNIYGIKKVYSIGQASSSKNIFDLQYQLRLNDLYDLTSTSIVYYNTVMNHLDLLDFELNGHDIYRFNRLQNRLYLDVNWATDLTFGQYLLIEGYGIMDPNKWSNIWNENWLKRYGVAVFKRQWATNIKKFSGLQLPGGVTLDGDKLYAEAISEIKELQDELQNKSAPLEFMMG